MSEAVRYNYFQMRSREATNSEMSAETRCDAQMNKAFD